MRAYSFIIILFTLSSCGVQYKAVNNVGQNQNDLELFLNSKTKILVYIKDFESNKFSSPYELKLEHFDKEQIAGTLTKPSRIPENYDALFRIPQESHDYYLKVIDTNIIDPTQLLHIYTFGETLKEGQFVLSRNKILEYDVYEIKTYYKYKMDKESNARPLDSLIRKKEVILLQVLSGTEKYENVKLTSIKIDDSQLTGTWSTSNKIPYPRGFKKFQFYPNTVINDSTYYQDSLFHPKDILQINVSKHTIEGNSITVPVNAIEEYYTFKRANKSTNQKARERKIIIASVALIIISPFFLIGF